MQTTKKSISPRITDESINPVIEDTVAQMPPKKIAPITEEVEHVKADAKAMKAFRRWEITHGKTNFMIPTTGKNDDIPDYVSIQGNDFLISKGVFLDLPLPIVDRLATKYKIQMNLGRDMRIDGNKEKMDALY